MYRVLHVIAMCIMGIDVVRLGISLNKCIEKSMQCILSELMEENSSANIVVHGSSLFGDFVIL